MKFTQYKSTFINMFYKLYLSVTTDTNIFLMEQKYIINGKHYCLYWYISFYIFIKIHIKHIEIKNEAGEQ